METQNETTTKKTKQKKKTQKTKSIVIALSLSLSLISLSLFICDCYTLLGYDYWKRRDIFNFLHNKSKPKPTRDVIITVQLL
jgi:hypothetical protein